MTKVFTDVSKFMKAAGQDHPDSPIAEPSDLSKLYKKLIDEEYEEFCEAIDEQDKAGQLDACFDMMWVIVGYMHTMGWDCEKSWDEGALSNLVKIDPETGLVRRRSDGKILKPDGWKSPNFEQFV